MTITSQSHDFASVAAAELHAAEKAIDAAISNTSQLITLLSSGRSQAGFAAAVGQRGFESLAAVIPNLAAARGGLVQAHQRLERDARHLGVTWAFAPGETKPTDPIKELRPTGRLAEEV